VGIEAMRKHEKGQSLGAIATLQSYARAFGCDVSELISERAEEALASGSEASRTDFVQAVNKALRVNRESDLGLSEEKLADLAYEIFRGITDKKTPSADGNGATHQYHG
jgi:hypothetical protein